VRPPKNKNDLLILGILAALTAGTLLVFVITGWVKEKKQDVPGVRTTRSANVDAAIVCYTLFEKLGVGVNRVDKNLTAETLDDIDVLFLLDAVIPVHSGQIGDLQAWILKGGVLICTQIPSGLISKTDVLNNSRKLDSDYYRSRRRTTQSIPHKGTFIPSEKKDMPLARDVSNVFFDTFEFFDTDVINNDDPNSGFTPLLTDSAGLRVVSQKSGRGHVIVLSDSSFLANGRIGRQDNSVLAVNLVSYALSLAKGKAVAFDEYHLGYGRHETGFGILGKMTVSTPAGWAVMSLAAAGVLFLVYKGRRFGIRRGLENHRRRSKLEYIYAVGSTYRSAGANRLTLKIILNWFKHRAIGLAGLAPNASNSAIAAALTGPGGSDLQKYKTILDRCDILLTQNSLSQHQLLLTLKQLGQIELEVFNERRSRK